MFNLNLPYNINLDVSMVAGLVDTFGAVIMLGSDIWFTNMGIDIMSLVKPDSAVNNG